MQAPCVADRDNAPRSVEASTCYRNDDMLEAGLTRTSDVTGDRYRHLVTTARRLVPCDAVALLRLEAGTLVPVVVDGLRGEAVARRFPPSEHPRFAKILAATRPVRFHDHAMPDPFDGLLADPSWRPVARFTLRERDLVLLENTARSGR